MADTLMSLLVSIGADTGDLQKALGEADKMTSGFSTKMDKLGKGMLKVGGAMTLGVTAPIVAFGVSSVQSFMESENSLANLNATIESTGGKAGITADEVIALASSFEKVTKFSDEAILNGQSMLLTFTNIGKDVFPDATEAMLNMAEKFGSIDQASIQLGKALNDPVSGVAALRRVGVMLTDQQEQQIKDFMAVNDLAGAQGVILGELGVEFGGLAKAAGETTAGKIAQLTNQFDNMKETMGGLLIPLVIKLMEAITPLIEKFANASPEMQKWIVIGAGIVAALGPVISIIGAVVTAIGAIGPIIAAIGAAIAGPVLLPILAVIAVLALLAAAWVNNWGGIQEKFAVFVAWITPVWDALWSGLVAVFGFVWAQIKTLWEAFSLLFQGDFRGFGEKLREAWDRAWGFIKAVAAGAWEFLKGAFVNLVTSIVDYFKNIDWANLGRNVITGIVNGLRNGISAIVNAARAVGQAIGNTIAGFLGIHSPSALMKHYGQMTAQGFADGLTANSKILDVTKALNINPNVTGVSQSTPAATPSQAKQGQNITVNVTNPKGETTEDSIRKTLKSLSFTGALT